jgi:UDP-2,3-diacylglucosamine hydrolase
MTTLFIADVHLPAQVEHPISRAFIAFMQNKAREAEHLYILGDLFDGWLGDDIGLVIYAPMIQVLADYTRAGHQLSICTGNRDFLLKADFATATGARLLNDETEITLGKETAVLLHGDTICTDDTEYLSLRKTLHNSEWQAQILQKTVAERLAFAQQLKDSSRNEKHQKDDAIMDVTIEGITDLLTRYPNVTHIIHGHTHKPNHHLLPDNKHRWVVSDWHTEAIQLLSWQQEIRLETMNSDKINA